MTILLVCDQRVAAEEIAAHLSASRPLQVYTACTFVEMEAVLGSATQLDLMLFTAAFRYGRGKVLRERARERFPQMQVAHISDDEGETYPAYYVVQWVETIFQQSASPPPGQPTSGHDDHIPSVLGDYELKEKRRSLEKTITYFAIQHSVARPGVVEVLRPTLSADPAEVTAFDVLVKTRARVSHPHIAAVYENQEIEGIHFYAREFIPGTDLEQAHAKKELQPARRAIQIIRTVAEALAWMKEKNIPRARCELRHIYPGQDPTSPPRLTNLADSIPRPLSAPEEIRRLAAALRDTQDPYSPREYTRELRHLLGLMLAEGPLAITQWQQVAEEARHAQQRLADAPTFLTEEARPATARRQRHRLIWLGLFLLALAATSWFLIAQRELRLQPRDFAAEITVPAGSLTTLGGQQVSIPSFTLDTYETTIGQYRAFLAALPHGELDRFDHPNQPTRKTTHEPPDWAALLAAATAGKTWKNYPLTMNTPVFNVDWWDATAYARWAGRRLPTSQEWSLAVQGSANAAAPLTQPTTLSEVDAHPDDVTPHGAYGMGGNLAEWVDTWNVHPELPDEKVPVFRGGYYSRQPSHLPHIDSRTATWLAKDALYLQPYIGFRTASSAPSVPSP